MSRTTLIHHARLVLPDQVIDDGSLLIEDSTIASICPDSDVADEHIDARGQVLMPGMIDLHSDAIESEIEPRPGVMLPTTFAIQQIDRSSAALGLTTVYHSLSFSGKELGLRNDELAASVARAVHAYAQTLHPCIDNRVHARYEVTNDAAISVLQELLAEEVLSLLSLMDHTPGQGQFQTMESYHNYLAKRYAYDTEALGTVIAEKLTAADGAWERATQLVEAAKQHDVPLASHDDDSASRVQMMIDLGVSLCEFPINAEAGEAIKEFGEHALVGSPNVFRGGSQSSGMRAIDAIEAGHADCLCSDYVPSTMLPAVWRVCDELGHSLPEAVRLVTLNPAEAVDLHDRGLLAPGLRADLLLVNEDGEYPSVTRTWSRGRCTFRSDA
ncbi:alpha-D-ribose 1-methylphosphonate 5-triphosphate diphosphatase [Algisphaera agarilytica]|uniref:Alpha-D-ribose 1-methylphosphonate 5-triphosphate diphosphatase n=1 Tax=Algisphaera agarilytica TaxID=1385975 RepID=A0A7X0H8R6_9BACT|nr:alpha-D-ribose 1-methylphosphonate 5-triphosphate diphosphatase [Algisphaera agarilytica]MBB6431375.1 alpha-D-ribose 1-methylphosphonate 5-triphosphate diphosphatase [Algisphaera agarilytica]